MDTRKYIHSRTLMQTFRKVHIDLRIVRTTDIDMFTHRITSLYCTHIYIRSLLFISKHKTHSCMSFRTHLHTYEHIQLDRCTQRPMLIYTRAYSNIYLHMNLYTNACTYTRMHTSAIHSYGNIPLHIMSNMAKYLYACADLHAHSHTGIHIFSHTCIHSHTHINT